MEFPAGGNSINYYYNTYNKDLFKIIYPFSGNILPLHNNISDE